MVIDHTTCHSQFAFFLSDWVQFLAGGNVSTNSHNHDRNWKQIVSKMNAIKHPLRLKALIPT